VLGVNYIGLSEKFLSIFLIAVLLGPLGSFPPLLPPQTDNPEINQILEQAKEVGLLDYFPNLGQIMKAEAMGKPEQENQGQGKSQMKFLDDVPTDSTPLQRGLMNAITIQKFGEDPTKPGNPKPGKKFNDKCEDPPGMGKGKGGRPCDNVPEFVTDVMMVEDLMKNGKKVGLRVMTETTITFDNPGKGPKKKNGDFNDKWDDFMVGKLNFKGVGNPMMDSMGKKTSNSGTINNANVFPDMAINDDNDCIDLITGEIFFGDGVDGTADGCLDENDNLLNTLETFSGDDGFACRHVDHAMLKMDRPELIVEFRGAMDGVDDDCYDENDQLKTSLVEQFDEDDFDIDINLDNDCQDASGKVFGGPAGSANSCFDVDMELNQVYS